MNCDALMCPSPATQALLYGCFNQHIVERYLCELHVALIMSISANITCGDCGEEYKEWLTGELP